MHHHMGDLGRSVEIPGLPADILTFLLPHRLRIKFAQPGALTQICFGSCFGKFGVTDVQYCKSELIGAYDAEILTTLLCRIEEIAKT